MATDDSAERIPNLPAAAWRRLAAYVIDIVPITGCVLAVACVFFDFDETFRRYLERGPRDHEARAEFLAQRNTIRDVSFALYVLASALFEASSLRATPGKKLVGIEVVRADGGRIGLGAAFIRNVIKIVSKVVCCLGCLWALWSPRGQTWHDLAAGALVVATTPPVVEPSGLDDNTR